MIQAFKVVSSCGGAGGVDAGGGEEALAARALARGGREIGSAVSTVQAVFFSMRWGW